MPENERMQLFGGSGDPLRVGRERHDRPAVQEPQGPKLGQIRKTFEWELEALGTDHADFGFLHCIDEDSDYEDILSAGILDYAKQMKAAGKVKYLGFSSHTPSVAQRILDTGLVDMMMFSINPAYDLAGHHRHPAGD